MSDTPSPLAAPEPWNLVADAYAVEIVPMFEAFSREALRIAGVDRGQRIVDVAAGPGTLTVLAARMGAHVSALDFSPEMLANLKARVSSEGLADVEAVHGDGMQLPYDDAAFDAGFSMFGLMFFPDRHRGLQELHRVLRPGACVVVSSWADLQRIPLLAAVMAVLGELVPGPAAPPRALPLADADACREEMSAAGFGEVSVRELVGRFEATSIEELVASFGRAHAPIAMLRKKLGADWPAVANKLSERLLERFGPGPHALEMPANLIVGLR